MKKLSITKEAFEKSKYFTSKYGKLEYVSESGKLFKTTKGNVLKFDEGMRREVEPMNGRASFGHKAMEEEDENGFTLYSYSMPVARLERRDDGSGLDFSLLDDYLSTTTLTHIHSWLLGHNQQDIPTKKLIKMNVGEIVPVSESTSRKHNTNKMKHINESKKLVKEGAGAGYTVHIKGLQTGKILNMQKKGKDPEDEYYEVEVEVLPCEVEIGAEDYYNDFFWEIHEYTDEAPTAQIDGGVINVLFTWYKDEDEIRQEIENTELDFDFDYGWGWSHVDLPVDKPIESDYIKTKNNDYYEIFKIKLNAPDLADAVNAGHQSIYDRDEEDEPEEDDGEEEEYAESTKKVVKEASEDFERFFETLKFKFRKDGCNVNLRDNEDGTEVIEIDAPASGDGRLFDFIKRKCEANNWFFERENGRLFTTYYIREDEEPINESFGDEDGWRVFDYGEDFPYTERYTVLDYDGYQFFIAHNGGVGAFTEDAIDEVDSDKISDALEIEIDGKPYRPRELDSDEISSNKIVQKGLNRIKVKYQYKKEKEDDLMAESYDNDWAEVGAAFDEFRQRLWKYTRKDRNNRMEFFMDCMKKCEYAFKEYHDACVVGN